MIKYPDLHSAIERLALVHSNIGVKIIKSEYTGEQASWAFDLRSLILQPHWLNRYAEIFWEMHAGHYPFQVCGMETAGIPLVAAIVMKGVERGTPVNGFYFRKSRKRYDLMKQVEGVITQDPVIIVDEILNTGGTVHKQVKILEELKAKVTEIFCLVRFRSESAYEYLADSGSTLNTLYSLEDFNILLQDKLPLHIPKDSLDVVWHFQSPSPNFHLVVQKSAPVLDSKRVFFGTDSGVFYALNQETGIVAWQCKTVPNNQGKGILSSPALHEGVVYFGAYDGSVYALDAESGSLYWKYSGADWVGSSPALAPDLHLIYIGLEFGLWRKRGGIVALNLETGEEVWRVLHPSLTHGSPLYIQEEKMVIIGSNDCTLYAYNAKDGTLLWTYITEGDIKMAPAYDTKRRIVIVASMDGAVYVISADTGKPVGAFKTEAGIYCSPLTHGDIMYVASLDKKIYAVDLDTFEQKWVYETGGRIFSSPALFDGSLWIGSNDGRLYELDPQNGTLRSFFQATERVVARIAYNPTTKHIFMHTVANEMYCLRRSIRGT